MAPPLKVARPVTPKVPPSVLAPVPTVNVFVPVTEVAPLSEIAPVPVEKVPEPVCEKVPEVDRLPVAATLPPNVAVPVPRKEKDGLVVALPTLTFSVVLDVVTAR